MSPSVEAKTSASPTRRRAGPCRERPALAGWSGLAHAEEVVDGPDLEGGDVEIEDASGDGASPGRAIALEDVGGGDVLGGFGERSVRGSPRALAPEDGGVVLRIVQARSVQHLARFFQVAAQSLVPAEDGG